MNQVDVMIIGAGPVGISAGLSFMGKGLSVCVIEKAPKRAYDQDGRGYALSASTVQVLEDIQIWKGLKAQATAIKSIDVVEKDTSSKLSFTPEDYTQEALGYLVESHFLNGALQKAADKLDVFYASEVTSMKVTPGHQHVTLSDGKTIKAKLVVASDGKYSKMRDLMGIDFKTHDYLQPAFVTRVSHTLPHDNKAFEVFFKKQGLIASLPLQGNQSSIVWCMAQKQAETLKEADAEVIEAALMKVFPDLGDLKLAAPCFTYPLKAVLSDRLVADRFVLLGDAAQSIHPVAGQGLNLGFKGLRSLIKHIGPLQSLGLDIGSSQFLKKYEKEYMKERKKLYFLTDGLIQLYDTDIKILRPLRRTGLSLINQITPLKRAMIAEAM